MKSLLDMRVLLALAAAALVYAAGRTSGRKTERRKMEEETRAGDRLTIDADPAP